MLEISENLSYEKAEARLEEIIEQLNNADTSLDDSLKLVEEATKLTAFCMSKLENAKAKITELEK